MRSTVSLDLTIEDVELIKKGLKSWCQEPTHHAFEVGITLAALGGQSNPRDMMDKTDADVAKRKEEVADLEARLSNL